MLPSPLLVLLTQSRGAQQLCRRHPARRPTSSPAAAISPRGPRGTGTDVLLLMIKFYAAQGTALFFLLSTYRFEKKCLSAWSPLTCVTALFFLTTSHDQAEEQKFQSRRAAWWAVEWAVQWAPSILPYHP